MPFSLAQRVAIVTGAGRGLGRAIATVFGDAGCAVVLVGRDESHLREVDAELRARGARALTVAGDVSGADAARTIVATAMRDLGRIDILVNNAGINSAGPIETVTEDTWETVIATNLTAVYRLCREAAGPMRERHYGRIVNIASITAQTGGVSGSVAYSASKGGLLAMTRTLSRDLAPHGVTVNAIAPGQIDTGMGRAVGPEALRKLEAAIPLGRIGTPDDIAYAALFLASEEAGYITGTTLDVNGGLLKR